MMSRIQSVFLFCLLAGALVGCGSDGDDRAGGLAGNVEVGFFYPMPVSDCDVEYDVYATDTPPQGERVSDAFDFPCFEMVPDEQGFIPFAVLDLPPGEWTVYVSVDQHFGSSYCGGRSDFVVEEGQVTEVEVILICG